MKTNCILILVLGLSGLNLKAQHFESALKTLNAEYPQEKLYLHTDKSVYNAGETIWFKAYLFAGHFPSLVSKTIYTELVDSKGQVFQRITSPVLMSGATGAIDIPENIGGTMYIRSYSKWMLNFDSAFLYTKPILIIGIKEKNLPKSNHSFKSNENIISNTSSSTILQFFPEGGDLIKDVESRVAFKATNNSGQPINITGEIVDSKGQIISSFKSMHDGMGTFTIQPVNGEIYKAVWKADLNETYEKLLPSAKGNGIVLEVNNNSNQIEFKIKRNSNAVTYPYVYVVAQMNQQFLYRAKVNLSKSSTIDGIIPIKNFRTGIVQVTIFTPEEKPLAERITFIQPAGYSFKVDLNTPVTDIGKRKKNVIEINVPDTLLCNFSMSITDNDLHPLNSTENIYSQLLLSSDIKGYVYNAAYYFSSDADSVANHLDLVMMTNGWRRFKWENVLTGKFPEIKFLPENYLSVEGDIKGLKKELLSDKEISGIIELKDRKKEYLTIPIHDGKFSFSGIVFYDTAKFFYQFNKDKNKLLTSKANFVFKNNLLKDPLQILPDNQYAPGLTWLDTTMVSKNRGIYQEYLNKTQLRKIKTLETVVVTTKKKSEKQLIDEQYTSGFFGDDPSRQSRIILPEEDPAFLASESLLAYLQNRIAGLQVNKDASEDAITWRGFATALYVNEIPQTSMNTLGKIIQDASYIRSISMSEIAMVKIFNPPFFGATSSSTGGQGGAVSVYLKSGARRDVVNLIDHVLLPGYSPIKEFYSPDYSILPQSDVIDYRTTLYWNPFIVTHKDQQKVTVSFYNNDFTKTTKLVLEGCNEDGKLIRIERILK
ncbi:MAG TPA: hypothetical protein VF622_13475 [Segetibacter sp.]|jgi:hypothetical protein